MAREFFPNGRRAVSSLGYARRCSMTSTDSQASGQKPLLSSSRVNVAILLEKNGDSLRSISCFSSQAMQA
jgi:hypothetical protein